MDGEDEEDKLITDASVKIEATDGISIKGDVEANRPVNLLFFCDADVATGSITIDNSTGNWAGTLAIKANRNGGSSQFVIGGEDESNGVNGTIVTDTVDGGSTSTDTFWQGGVYISNHGDGGIKLTNATDISVKGTNSACGGIILDADDGTIELPTGTLSADGTGNFAGAVIQLLADTLETEDGTVISASDNGQSGKAKNVQISVETINLTGSSGLTIRCDGGGNATYKTALQILPKGCVVLYDSDEPSYFTIWSYVLAPDQIDHPFRRNPITDSKINRSPIPIWPGRLSRDVHYSQRLPFAICTTGSINRS